MVYAVVFVTYRHKGQLAGRKAVILQRTIHSCRGNAGMNTHLACMQEREKKVGVAAEVEEKMRAARKPESKPLVALSYSRVARVARLLLLIKYHNFT